ncbi:MAG: cupin domain-containing protein [Candidatus Woesearchaeota archaeon]|nr:cupin domain-containing protein [Candidatus Woesearchaeota archaeon]
MEPLQYATWATTQGGLLVPRSEKFPIQMSKSDATAYPLLLYEQNKFGAEIIRFGAEERVARHTHKGDHILLVTKGEGVLGYGTSEHPISAGMAYLVPGSVPHSIDATTELALIAIGNDHRPADSSRRLDLVE